MAILLEPPYSPELNLIENLWHWTNSRYMSNRTLADYDELMNGVGAAWWSLTRSRLRSVCRCGYLTRKRAESSRCVLERPAGAARAAAESVSAEGGTGQSVRAAHRQGWQ